MPVRLDYSTIWELSVRPDWHVANLTFCAALCLGLFYSSRTAYGRLLEVRRLTQITSKPEPEMPELFTQKTENAIGEETLRVLAFSPGTDLSEAARRMVIDRVLHQANYWDIMIDNISGANGFELQEESLAALRYVYQRTAFIPRRDKTMRAIVHCLKKRLPTVRERDHLPDTDWKQRTQGERDAMQILYNEVEIQSDKLLESTGLVEKWLAHYPFGGHGAVQKRRMEVVRRLLNKKTDDEHLASILLAIYKTSNGRKHLKAAGLISNAFREVGLNGSGMERIEWDSFHETRVDGVTLHAPPETPGEHDGEDPEARLRRRRRNTVVTGDIPD